MNRRPCAAANPAIAPRLQAWSLLGRVAELVRRVPYGTAATYTRIL